MNANNPQTPGVYTVEKSAFPPSIGEVPTAIPAFIGYTEMATVRGKSVHNLPVLISSLAEYTKYFGGAAPTQFPVVKVAPPPGKPVPAPGTYDFTMGGEYYAVKEAASANFYVYNSVQLFYMNGGGQAYIVSVGEYFTPTDVAGKTEDVVTVAAKEDLLDGLAALRTIQFPKPTMIVMSDGLSLSSKNDYVVLQQQMLMQAGELMDRVALLDIWQGDQDVSTGVISAFRNAIGLNSLSYGVAYYPWLNTSIVDTSDVTYANVYQPAQPPAGYTPVKMTDLFAGPIVTALGSLTTDEQTLEKYLLVPPAPAAGSGPAYITWTSYFKGTPPSADQGSTPQAGMLAQQGTVIADMYNILFQLGSKGSSSTNPNLKLVDSDLIGAVANFTSANGTLAQTLESLAAYETNFPGGVPKTPINSGMGTWKLTAATADPYGTLAGDPSIQAIEAYNLASVAYQNAFNLMLQALNGVITNCKTLLKQNNTAMENSDPSYKTLMQAIANKWNILPPSGAMAGVYTMNDNTVGVWNSPANVNIDSVVSPTVSINDQQQAPLNVDVLAGKSVNVIRSFYGRGPAIVWGARTLDGNDENYRYVAVRRTLIMIEQSVANATQSFVFAPNDEATWDSCTSMIENFLNSIWLSGGLQGAKAADAYKVECGLGATMTAQDILDGIMRVSVKLAMIHPAEFIIITYEQMMATS
ncbi:MAG: phage tail sheath C-terminal domain-containing protein [Bacteroidota bacterium]